MTEKVQARARGGWPLVWALAAGQLVTWGIIYYAFSLFVVPMEEALGWSRTALNGALSLGLLVAGLCAFAVGSWIDRQGGRWLMTCGSVLGVGAMLAWSRVESLPAFYVIWIVLGLAQSMTLYEPVFAVITRHFSESYRTKITALTLVGGLASTVFIPLTQLFIDLFGWRDALVALGVCLFLVPLPVHLFWLRDRSGGESSIAPSRSGGGRALLGRALRHPVFWGLVTCFVCYNGTFSAMTFHLIPLLTERDFATATIIAALTVIGPAQVGGRLVIFAFSRKLPTALVGRITVVAFPISVMLLILFPRSVTALFAFSLIYGAANGIMTIIRGTSVPDLLWREHYGATNGALTFPTTIARALSPFGAALIWRALGGYDAVLWTVFTGGCVAVAGFWFAVAKSTMPR
jgi:predicted MFS family arabinose efflux permease